MFFFVGHGPGWLASFLSFWYRSRVGSGKTASNRKSVLCPKMGGDDLRRAKKQSVVIKKSRLKGFGADAIHFQKINHNIK
jgi:hypothetical protein